MSGSEAAAESYFGFPTTRFYDDVNNLSQDFLCDALDAVQRHLSAREPPVASPLDIERIINLIHAQMIKTIDEASDIFDAYCEANVFKVEPGFAKTLAGHERSRLAIAENKRLWRLLGAKQEEIFKLKNQNSQMVVQLQAKEERSNNIERLIQRMAQIAEILGNVKKDSEAEVREMLQTASDLLAALKELEKKHVVDH